MRSVSPLRGCSVVRTDSAPGMIVSTHFIWFLIIYHLVPNGTSNSGSIATFAPIQRSSSLFTVTPASLDALVLVIIAPVDILVVVAIVEVLDVASLPPFLQGCLTPGSVLFSTGRFIFGSPLLA